MEIKPKLINIWKSNGLNQEQIKARAESSGYKLPVDFDLIATPLRNPRLAGSVKNYSIQSFRPTPENDTYLKNLPKFKKSEFINKAISFYIKSQEEKWKSTTNK